MLAQVLVADLFLTAFVGALVLDVLDHRLCQQAPVVPHRLPAVGAGQLPVGQHCLLAGDAYKMPFWTGGHGALGGEEQTNRTLNFCFQLCQQLIMLLQHPLILLHHLLLFLGQLRVLLCQLLVMHE